MAIHLPAASVDDLERVMGEIIKGGESMRKLSLSDQLSKDQYEHDQTVSFANLFFDFKKEKPA